MANQNLVKPDSGEIFNSSHVPIYIIFFTVINLWKAPCKNEHEDGLLANMECTFWVFITFCKVQHCDNIIIRVIFQL